MKTRFLSIKQIISLIAIMIVANMGFAQGTFVPKINSIPSSPEAALLERFENIPVSHYTGSPDISIPLYTIRQNGMEIPLVLRYQASGIKVADEATWVGLGWSLDPGGSISQEIRGKNDDYDPTYTNHYIGGSLSEYNTLKSHLNGGNYASTTQTGKCMMTAISLDLQTAWTCTSDMDGGSVMTALLNGDGQPDIYHYSLPGYSGQYFIHPETGLFKLMDKKAEIGFSHLNQTIKALAPDGTIFNFNTYEDSHAGGGINVSGRTYKLTSVAFPTSDAQVTFSYADELYTSFYNQANIVLNAMENNQPHTIFAEGPSMTSGTKKRLMQIKAPDVTITFNVTGREDFEQNSLNTITKLESIDIRSNITGKLIKSLKFTYEYINPTGTYQNKRLKLKGVREVGYDYGTQLLDASKPGYSFEYDETVGLPAKNSRSVDFWGYYNGAINSTLIPDLDFFDYRHQIMTDNVPDFDYHPSYKANRYPNNAVAKAQLLKKVIYPTGGYTEYIFEPHSFDNKFIPNQQQLQQMVQTPTCNSGPYYTTADKERTLSIHEDTALPMSINFTHGSPTGTNSDNVKSAIYYNDSSYVKIYKIKNGLKTELKKWTAAYNLTSFSQFSTGGTSISEDFFIEYEEGATYKLRASCPTLLPTTYSTPNLAPIGAHVSTHYYDKLGVPQVSQHAGFRIKSIKSYSSPNVVAYNKQYSYSGGKLLNEFYPLKWTPAAYHQNFSGTGGYSTVFNKRVTLSTEYFGNSPGNPVGYDMVEEVTWDVNDLTTNGRKKYYFQNVMNLGATGLPTALNFHNGILNKEQTLNKDGDVVEEKIQSYIYLPFSDPYFTAITIQNHQFGQGDGPPSSTQIWGQPYINYKFSFPTYPLICDWYMLGSTQTKQYLNGIEVSSLTSYEYNSTGQQKSVITSNSLQQELKTLTSYCDDLPYGDPIEQTLANNHMLSIPIKTEVFNNTISTSTAKNAFAQNSTTSSKVLLKYIYSLKGGDTGPLQKRVTYDLYDSRGNILQYHLEDGIPVSIVWGYNMTLPVAKLEDVAYSSISSTTITNIANQTAAVVPPAAPTYNEASLLTSLNSLRTAFPLAMVTTYIYTPGIGVKIITDPKGDTFTYTYDNYGRLLNVKDRSSKILTENEYHYRP